MVVAWLGVAYRGLMLGHKEAGQLGHLQDVEKQQI
jgi:hypothetical protein